MKAYILIHTRAGRGPTVTKEVSAIKGVISVDEVAGPYDVIVHAEARSLDELSRRVVARIQEVEGVERTLACSVVAIWFHPRTGGLTGFARVTSPRRENIRFFGSGSPLMSASVAR